MAALLVAMTGCQKEPQMGSEGTDANAKAYVSLKINLPTEVGRRAEGFNDGDPKEYSVNNVTLVFFNAEKKVVFTKVGTQILIKIYSLYFWIKTCYRLASSYLSCSDL